MKTLVLLCLLWASPAFAQPPAQQHHIQANSRVFIEPMEGFETYLTAAIMKKQVPLVIVDDKSKADYVITGNSHVLPASWAKTIFLSGAPQAGASIIVKNAKSGDLVFAYAVDKFNAARASQSTAEACAKHMKQDIEKQTKW